MVKVKIRVSMYFFFFFFCCAIAHNYIVNETIDTNNNYKIRM